MSAGRYRLDRRIATGGMGEVWRGTDTLLERPVAVKVLKSEYSDDTTFRSRFEAEARHAASLHHHNVASVFDVGELAARDGSGRPRPYLVMELVPGRPLSALLEAGEPMPPERAADLAAQAADGLRAAHLLGIVHRDVKPANLLVTPRGQVKITDFGIARAGAGAALTQTGQVLGTPAYISPEQAEGRPATAASDIYSLGVVLYECLAGHRPFGGDTPVATALAHLRDAPPPLPETVPAHLRDVVDTALAKSPEERFASVADLAAALRGGPIVTATPAATAVGAGVSTDTTSTQRLSTTTGTTHRRRAGWLPWVAAAAGLLVVVTLVVWVGNRDMSPPAAAGTETPGRTSPAASPSADARFRVRARDFVGMPADEARARLEDHDLRVRRVIVANPGGKRAGHVSAVSPTGLVDPGALVTLSVWGPVPQTEEPAAEPRHEPKTTPKKHPGKAGDHGKAKGHKKKGH